MVKIDLDFQKNFEKHKEGLKNEEILERVRLYEKQWRHNRFLFIGLTLIGNILIIIPGGLESSGLFWGFKFSGLFWGVFGMILLLHNEISTQIRLGHLHNYWISNNQFEAEIRKSEAADL